MSFGKSSDNLAVVNADFCLFIIDLGRSYLNHPLRFAFFKTSRSITLSIGALLLSIAQCNAENVVCTRGKDCPTDSGWDIGIALGIGVRTNPLVDGDDIPLVVLPDIAYSWKNLYFDNAELGARWKLSQRQQLSVFVTPNRERANFSFWHTANIFTSLTQVEASPDIGSDVEDSPIEQDFIETEVSIDDIDERQWAYDAGVRLRIKLGNHFLSFAAQSDISGIYDGSHASIALTNLSNWGQWRIQVSPFVRWHSSDLSNYYYGIREADLVDQGLGYDANGGFQIGFQTLFSRPVYKKWDLIILAGALRLHDGMYKSPLVEKRVIMNGFMGMAYRF